MFAWLKSDPTKKLTQQRDSFLEQAFQAQRNGNIREYSRLTSEADALTQKLEALTAEAKAK